MSLVNEKIGAWLMQGHSRAELAEAVGLSRPALNKRIEGKSKWKWSEMVRLSDVIGCSLNELAGIKE
jgi:plasmid maintenance system antidote protein VapI